MLYPELFRSLEQVRWNMETDIPWDQFDAASLTDEQAQTIRMNAITEWSALPATEMFLRDNRNDSDFSAFMSVWFFEEQKHSLVLWPFHGVFGSGPTLDETFGLIDTAEKSAEVLVKIYSMGGMKQTISQAELIALGKRFGVTPLQSAIDLYK